MKKLLIITALTLLLPAVGLCWSVQDALKAVVAAKNGGGGEPPAGDITFVSSTLTYSASGTQIECTAINAVSGNAIVVFTHNGSATTVTDVADTASNSYSKIGGTWTPSGNYMNEAYLAENITGNANNVITVTFSGSSGDMACGVAQYSGVATSSANDTGFTPDALLDISTPYTSNADTTAADGEMIVGFVYNTDSTTTFSNGTGTIRSNALDVWVVIDRLTTTAGSYTIDVDGNSGENHAVMAVAIKK